MSSYANAIHQNKESVTLPKNVLPIIASSDLREVDIRLLIYLFGFLDGVELNARPIDLNVAAKHIKKFSKKQLKDAKKHLVEEGILIEVPSKYSKKAYILDLEHPGLFHSINDRFDGLFSDFIEVSEN